MISTKRKSDGTIRVTFALPADTPPASVVGDFNGWDPLANPLRKRSNGTRSAVVELPAGSRVRFRYLLDGDRWLDEPEVDRVDNGHGAADCLLLL